MTNSKKSSVFVWFLLLSLPPTTYGFGWWGNEGEEDDEGSFYEPQVQAAEDKVDQVPENFYEEAATPEYGVDVSFPMHHMKVSDNYQWLPHNKDPEHWRTPAKFAGTPVQPLGDRQKFYDDFIQGCVKHYGKKGNRCISTEKDRVDMSLRQPQSMQNYTEIGYKKIRAPKELFKLISEFWETNKDSAKIENWGIGNTYTNNWEAPTSMVSVEDGGLRGGGFALKQAIWNAAKEVISEWTGQELTQCSLYGIRVYKENAVLATHVDRLPLVSSAIINVAQDVDEPWPLEVIGHSGKAENVTMLPGDMVLYESHSVLHGRPFPLKGRFLANLFVHFEPTGHTLRHHGMEHNDGSDVDEKYKIDVQNGKSGHENEDSDLPPYLIPGSPEESNWRISHPSPNKNAKPKKVPDFSTGSTELHAYAQAGDLESVKKHVTEKGAKSVNQIDRNGWTPLHEASRAGHLEVIKFLVENGADVNVRTRHGAGESSLWWAKQQHGADSPIVTYLEGVGADELGPEL